MRSTRPFHVLIKPFGARCNIECAYCFYTPKLGLYPREVGARMSDEVLERFVSSYIEAQPFGAEEVEFAWQGGEPTLAGLDFFKRAVALQRAHARPGLTVRNSLQTNGTLLDDEWCEFLREERFLVGLSLDGPADLHDAQRVDHSGAGTFERVMSALRRLQRRRVEFNVLTVVHRLNAAEPERVYDFLVGTGARHLQFIPLVELDGQQRVSERSVAAPAYGQFLSRVFDLWLAREHVGRVFVRDFDSALASTLGVPGSTCVAAETCGRCVALERDGDVFACDHFVDWAHHLGNLRQRDLAAMLDQGPGPEFGASKADLPAECERCPHLRLCRGGCPKDRVAGRNVLCEGYAAWFAHAKPVLERMARCLRAQRPASDWRHIDAPPHAAALERNAACPCGSGRKWKRCCGA